MSERLRIAIAQTSITSDPRSNGPAIRAQMREAAQAGARLIQFTEGAMSGYPAGPGDQTQADWAALREELEETAALAGSLGLWAVIGANHPLTPPHRPHNSLYVLSDRGVLAGRYDKRLLSNNEVTNHHVPGAEPLLFEVDGFRIGCALCIEIQFPELFVDYARGDADIVLLSTFSRDPMFAIQAQGHAACGTFWLGFAVPAQYSEVVPSGLIGPHGQWLVRAPADGKPALAMADLDRGDEALRIPLVHARPWRALARSGAQHDPARVTDPRSTEKAAF